MRNHEKEFQDNAARQYAYDFDSIVRRYMMRTFSPLFRAGKALELGCFEGDSTKLFAEHFDDLTVVEASRELLGRARGKVGAHVQFIHSTFEELSLPPQFDFIFLVHTLEHLDAPVETLRRIRSWLSSNGLLFIVVPNAMAPSRQIAVKMGLIEYNHAVTPGEREHGHRCTYSFDTLESDARAANLAVRSRGGILFKPFANFQFDLLIKNKIIDMAYIEGCYALGMQYPELTSSIYLVCSAD